MKTHGLINPTCIAYCMLWVAPLAVSLAAWPVPVSAQEEDLLAVSRPNPVYTSVLTGNSAKRLVTSYHNRFYTYAKAGAEEQRNVLLEYGAAAVDGPFVPRFMERLGEPLVEEMFQKHSIRFPYFPHNGAFVKPAKQAGAVFMFADEYGSGEKGVASWDPHYRDAANAGMEEWLRKYGKKPWLSCVLGVDEPLNYAGTVRNAAVVDTINKELKDKYGIKLRLTAQNPRLVQPWTTTDSGVLNKDPHDVALLRIAIWRWLNDQLYESARREHKIVKTYAPHLRYYAYNRNAISIVDFINKFVPNSIDRIDQARLHDVTDGFSADPYPTYNLKSQGQPRALYHVGFASKMIADLAGGKPSKIILQAFKFHDRLPTPANIREWASQAAKAGVIDLEWFGDPRPEDPALYLELLRLSKLWKNLPALDIPKTSDIAVVFSDDSRNAANDDLLNAHYLLHVLLGEKLGAWYTIVGENNVRRGTQSLDGFKLIIAPQLSYLSKSFADRLIKSAEGGTTLVVLDPDALTWDIETGSLLAERKRLLGSILWKKREASHFLPSTEGQKRFAGMDLMLIQPGRWGEIARTPEIPKDGRVLFNYEDGTPGVYSRRLGKGEVIVFSAMPLADCGPGYSIGTAGVGIQKTGWDNFLAVLCKELDIKTGLPIWQFLFPQ